MTVDTLPPDLARWVGLLGPARQLAEVLAETEFVPKAMRGQPDVVTAAIMYGDELGLGPMQSLAGLDVVEGRPRPSAELARALILRAGHTFVVHDATGTRVRVSGLRAGRPEAERVHVEWTMDMARAAGLVNKQNWRAYPRAMLMARATSDLARILFPDVVKGLGYVAETEADAATLESWMGPEPEPVTDLPPVAPIQRRTRPRAVGPTPEIAGQAPVEEPPGTPPADLPPEHPGADPDAEVTPEAGAITEEQRRALFAAVGRVLGPEAQRAERLALCTAVVGRDVPSANDLTRSEASAVLSWLRSHESGLVSWEWDPETGTGRIARADHDPPEPTPEGDPWA